MGGTCQDAAVVIARYLTRVLLGRLLWTLPALVLVYLAFDLGDQGRRLAAELGWRPVLLASALHLPLVAVQVLPAALLLALLLGLSRLRHAGELDALVVAGAGPLRLAGPLLASGALAAALALALDEGLAARCEAWADALLGVHRASALTGAQPPPRWLRQGRWLVGLEPEPAGRPPRATALEVEGSRALRRIDGRLEERGLSGVETRFAAGLQADPPRLALAPLWREAAVRPEAQGFLALRSRLRALAAAGQPRPAEELVLHSRLTHPLLNLVVALLAWPFALGAHRRALLADLLRGLGLLGGLWCLLAAGWLAARAGWLSPAAGAWAPLGVALGLVALLLAATSLGRRPKVR